MKLSQIALNGSCTLCAVCDGRLFPLTSAGYHTLKDALDRPDGLKDALALAREHSSFEPEQVRFLPVSSAPGKILCVGVNYRKHIEECGETLPVIPVLFNKFSNALAAHEEIIHPPLPSSQIDYEAELVVIIGKGGKNIPESEALNHVFGYTCGNDISARDIQLRTSQWMSGKTCDGFAPIGPWIVTADEIDPHSLPICSRLNGEIRQSDNTSSMIFPVERIISYISSLMTLEASDIIFTGTPDGVILGKPEQERIWMQEGDMVEIEIGGIGILRNTIGCRQ